MSAYFNTTGATGHELAGYRAAALSQEQRIVSLFRKHRRPLSPSEVHRLGKFTAPLTSTRRAMTRLTAAGVLERTEIKVKGAYGRPEHRWTLRGEMRQEALL